MTEEKADPKDMDIDKDKVPYDRGWAWMCVIGCCLMNVFIVGGFKCFGLLFVEFLEIFQSTSSATALVAALTGVFNFTLAPIGTGLGRRYSYRVVVMIGGFCTGLGCMVSAYAASLPQVICFYGILTGTGYAFCYPCSFVVVGEYFRKRRALANGIAVAGSSIGTFVLPPLIRFLIDEYTFRGALLILGGILFNLILCGALYRPLSFYQRKFPRASKEPENTGLLTVDQREETEAISVSNRSLHSGKLSMDSSLLDTAATKTSLSYKVSSIGSLHLVSAPALTQNGSVPSHINSPERDKGKCLTILKAFMVCEFSVCRSPVFHVFIIGAFLGNLGYTNVFLLIPPFAQELEISKQKASFLLSMAGIADLIGRLSCGMFANLRLVHTRILFMIFLLLMGLNHLIIPLVGTYGSFVAYCVLLGLLGGCYMATLPTLLADLMGTERISAAFGFLSTAFGISVTIGPPVLGLIQDIQGSYASGFYFCAVSLFIGAFTFLLYPFAKRSERGKRHLDLMSELPMTERTAES